MFVNEKPNELLLEKYEELKKYLSSFESVAVAFSSGVDIDMSGAEQTRNRRPYTSLRRKELYE